MSEFKGTKEKWVYCGGDNNSVEVEIGQTTASITRDDKNTGEYVISRQEMEANAKLIASAPEMLEKLKECSDFLNRVQAPVTASNFLKNEIDTLIKKATEL